MRSRSVVAGAAGALAFAAVSFAQTPAVGPQFVVNATTASAQVQPAVAMDPSGNFTVVWQGFVPPADGSLFARRFDVFGAALSGEFQVESSPPNSGSEAFPSMAMDGSGNFVVAWEQDDQDYGGVYGRLFNAAGVAQGPQFQINSYSTSYQYGPSVARNASGDFVVVWQSNQDGDYDGIYAQRYDAAGAAQGSEFRVNTYTTDYQTNPSIAMNAAGGFVVVWQSDNQDGSDEGVFGQRYDATGAPVGAEFRVNTYTTNNQENPRVAGDSSGGFVVVWQSFGQDGFSAGIFGRRYDATGAPQGGEFLVNTATTAGETDPAVSMDGAGNFVVAWRTSEGLSGQRFDSAGRRVGSQFPVGVPPFGGQPLDREVVALNATGNFVVAWQGNDGNNYGIEARRSEFRAAGVMEVDEPAAAVVARPEAVAGNRVLEAGETVTVAPTWTNTLQGTVVAVGGSSNFTGPAGGTYTLNDAAADYGSVAQGATVNCEDATDNCYQVTVSGTRPATHWDATFQELINTFGFKTWTLHVGESFTDVPTSQLFYRAIESVLHAGITAGCTATNYCPADQVTRAQMSLFLARGVAGGGFAIPTVGFVGANAYSCGAGGTSLFTDVLPTDIFCRSVHYLASQNVTSGCSATQYCPTPNVTRLEMSAFVARAVVAPGGGAAVPLTYGPDPVTGFQYSCDQSNPNTHFTDVPASNGFCKHAHFLWAKGIISGCGATLYCPNDPVTRDAMARFLTNGFNARLYGP